MTVVDILRLSVLALVVLVLGACTAFVIVEWRFSRRSRTRTREQYDPTNHHDPTLRLDTRTYRTAVRRVAHIGYVPGREDD